MDNKKVNMITKEEHKMKRFTSCIVVLMVLMALVMIPGLVSAEENFSVGKKDLNGTLGQNGRSARLLFANTLIMEGVSDGFELTITPTNPTAARAIAFPDASGTVALTGDISSTMSLTDAKVLIGNSGGLAAEQTIGTGHSLLNSGALTHIANTVSSADILNGTIAATDMNLTLVIMNVASGVATTTETVTAGSVILGFYPIANVSSEILNSVSIASTTLTGVLNKTAVSEVVYGVRILAP